MAAIETMRSWFRDRHRMMQGAIALLTLLALVLTAVLLMGGARKPPSIFDSPVDDVLSFLAVEEFSKLSLAERMEFIGELFERFGSMNQSDSAVAAAFLAGLAGPAREQLRDNVRVLGRDILVEAADEYFALDDDKARSAYLDAWLTKWARLAANVTGEGKNETDAELLAQMHRQAQRDNEHNTRNPLVVDNEDAWLFMDYWHSEVESVSSASDQSKIFHFLPAVREHLLRGK